MDKMLEELTMLADILDVGGLHKEAADIDIVIKSIAEPQSGAVNQFVDALKEELKSVSAQEGFPTISDKSLPEIFSVIDNLVGQGTFLGPGMSPEKFQQYQEEQAEPLRAAAHMLTLEDDIKKIKALIEQTQDPEKLKDLNMYLQADIRELDELRQKIKQWQTGERSEDQLLYKQFIERYNSLKSTE
jgi:hypothetical protein